MTIAEITQTAGWKNFMKYLYGVGAAIVIVGALFKIMHWPGANIMIIAGLSTEAVIFIFSSFEPLHHELDWTLVYPELAGMTDPDELLHFKDDEKHQLEASDKPITRIEDLIGNSGVDPEALKSMTEGLNRLNQSAASMAEISDASFATKDYLSNMQNASQALSSLNETYSSTNETFKSSVGQLSNAYLASADAISKSGSDIANSYEAIAQTLQKEHESMAKGSQVYDTQIEQLNSKLSALNTAYELQLQATNEHLKDTGEIYKGLGQMVGSLKESVEETTRYKDEMSKLSESISSLNNIYGNMLSAMHVSKK